MLDATPLALRHTTREALDAAYDGGVAAARLRGRDGIAQAVRSARAAGYTEVSQTFRQFCAGYLDTMDRL